MRRSLLHDERGAALVEAALVLPVLLVLVFGLVEICLYSWQVGIANEAVQLGVRRAIVSDAAASGPGLNPAESAGYWDGLPPGAPCRDAATGGALCPTFRVTCPGLGACRCEGTACRFSFSAPRFAPILRSMRAVMPALAPENVEIVYATNDGGYVGRPVPVPADVTVRLVGLSYRTAFLGDLFGATLPLRASATLPGEDLATP